MACPKFVARLGRQRDILAKVSVRKVPAPQTQLIEIHNPPEPLSEMCNAQRGIDWMYKNSAQASSAGTHGVTKRIRKKN